MKLIIVGQGISGSVTGFCALKRGCEITVVDRGVKNSSSSVAAGVWNPITFRIPTLSYRAEAFIPSLFQFYPELEKVIEKKFFNPRTYLRIFSSQTEHNNWFGKCSEPAFSRFAGSRVIRPDKKLPLNAPYGAAEVKKAGFVDTEVLLAGFRDRLARQGVLIEEHFDQQNLTCTGAGVKYRSPAAGMIEADHIIFADGNAALQNGFFDFLPFRPVKGEVLTVKIPQLRTESIISKGFFLLPQGNGIFIAGATYSHEELNNNPTPGARNVLIEKLESCVSSPYEIIGQRAGIRPATIDRRPFSGTHPDHDRVHIFNGMGSKAVMMTPLLAEQLIDHLQGMGKIDPDVDIKRFM